MRASDVLAIVNDSSGQRTPYHFTIKLAMLTPKVDYYIIWLAYARYAAKAAI